MHIVSINVGRVAPLNLGADHANSVESAIVKTPVSSKDEPRAIAVDWLGLEGDEQADRRVHGGRDRALYAYPVEHYPVWRTIRMQALKLDVDLPYGALGENLTLSGILETDVWVGDLLEFGPIGQPSVRARVVAPRMPCYKLNAHLGFKHAAQMMMQSAYCGFYLEVLSTGTLCAGEMLRIVPGERVVRIDERLRIGERELRRRAQAPLGNSY